MRAIATDGASLFVGGSFLAIGQTNAPYIARFDGTRWHSLGTGIGPSSASTVVNALVVSNTDVYVAGYFSTAGGVSAQSVARWDGASWHGLGGPGGMVYALAVRPEGLYALGTGYNGTTYGSAFCKLWNGTSWQDVLAFNPDDTFTQIFLNDIIGMNSIAFIGGDTYVGGHFGLVWHDPTLTVTTNCGNILRFRWNLRPCGRHWIQQQCQRHGGDWNRPVRGGTFHQCRRRDGQRHRPLGRQ